MSELDKKMIAKAMKRHKSKFSPKHKAFYILKKNIEDVVTKSTSIWKWIYGLSTPIIIEKGEQERKEPEKNEEEKDKDENLVKEANV